MLFPSKLAFPFLCLSLLLALPLHAVEKPSFTTKEIYAAFAKKGPQAVIAHARKAANYIQKGGDLNVFNEAHNQTWWPNRPFFTPVIVMRCDELRDVTHPIASMRPGLTQRNALRKFRDLDGQPTFHILCKKLPGNPRGLWLFQHHYWPDTKEPLQLAVLIWPIQGTPYQLQLFYPTTKYSLEQLNAFLN